MTACVPHQVTRVRDRAAWAQVLRALFADSRWALVMGLLLAIATVAMGVGLLGVAGWFITATALAGLHAATAIVFDVFGPSAGIRLLAIGRTASRYGERLSTHDATLSALTRLRESLFRAWAEPGTARALHLRPARLLFRLTGDLQALEAVYLRWAVPAAAALGGTLLVAFLTALRSAWLGVALFAALAVTGFGVAGALAWRSRHAGVRRALALEALRARAVDLVAGQTDLVMAGGLGVQQALMRAADDRMARADVALHRLEARAVWVQGVAGAALLAGVLLATAALAQAGHLSAPTACLLLLATMAASEGFGALQRGALEGGRTVLAVRRIGPGLQGEAVEPLVARLPAPGAAVTVQDLVVQAGDRRLLHMPVFTVAAGECVAIVGASGAGKSTLLAVLTGEQAAAGGQVAALPAAWLPQHGALFQDDVRHNVLLARPDADATALDAAIAGAGLAHDVARWPRGLATPLGEGGLGVSGGQARRLAIARLLLQPERALWLLDEPTESLDAASAATVLASLREASRGRAVVIATHLRRDAEWADRIVCMEHGHVVGEARRGSAAFAAALAALRPDAQDEPEANDVPAVPGAAAPMD